MPRFFYSATFLYILAALLLLAFFLPDLIGPLPALVVGSLIIGAALFVYNKWSQVAEDQRQDTADDDHSSANEE